ncbi:kinase-interacting protein 1 [Olea europaea var. sylvestris]|uniref:kinase-interacting protein 1 n=1 Tax=Olea europaea var. sylvestris TaxID=158386 RepID=UPI000C1D2ED2|nr:kinase-interacting protein 1 [Olea europaea var. sylvestris]
MLQRAASNAYSWWWASHIRTKQSKWLEQSLQDMEEKVQHVIKLIEEDGDSFAKRAEMYYKKRPELLHFVEESYRAFRALAERYDHLSNDLQKANHTIATVFPEQVQFAMDEDDECSSNLKIPKNSQVPPVDTEIIPKVPKAPIKDLKGLMTSASKKFPAKKSSKSENTPKNVVKSGLNKSEALEEIDKLQKEILALQTVKEFVKNSYEIGLEKYWGIENQITEMQQKVCGLQDEFGVDTVIEDDEARNLMAKAALKSCQETLVQLQEKQERSARDAKEEFDKIEDIRLRMESLRYKYLRDEADLEKPTENDKSANLGDESKSLTKDVDYTIQQSREIDIVVKKMNQDVVGSMESLTVTEFVEKIDELASKVINLETEVSSQTVLINTLRTEVDDLQAQIQNLEGENEIGIDGTCNLTTRVKVMDDKFHMIQDLNKKVETQNSNLATSFVKAHSNLDHLSEKLTSVKLDEEIEVNNLLLDENLKMMKTENAKDVTEEDIKELSVEDSVHNQQGEEKDVNTENVREEVINDQSVEESVRSQQGEGKDDNINIMKAKNTENVREEVINDQSVEESVRSQQGEGNDDNLNIMKAENTENVREEVINDQNQEESVHNQQGEGKETHKESIVLLDSKPLEQVSVECSNDKGNELNAESQKDTGKEDELDWQQKLLNGMEDREKILLTEYTTILRNYKDVKRKLSDMEKKELECQFEMAVHERELRDTIAKRDEEIQHLRQKLNHLQRTFNENGDLNTSKGQGVKSEAQTKVLEVQEDLISAKEDDVKFILIDQAPAISVVEEKLRMDIDAILDENLDFWLRFSTSFHLIQKFQAEVQDLRNEISQIKEKKRVAGSISTEIKSEVRPIYKHIKEIQTELTMWLEQSVSLNEELKRRLESLCSIQEQITIALKEGVEEDEIKFSSHQAAKFQGEVVNMKQENNKVSEELQAGLDHVNALQQEIEKTLRKLNEEFEIPGDQDRPELSNSESRTRIPLRSFIFGTKQKKQKHSIFSSMLHNRRYHVPRDGEPL